MTKFAFPAAAAMVLVSVVGCQSNDSKKMSSDPTVTQLSPAPMSPAPAAPMAPAPMTPAPMTAESTTPMTVTPAYAASPMAAAPTDMPADSATGSKYTVKKGDTLWKIAASKYGDGKQYKKICQANPGLTPAGLKVGQTITLP